MCISTAHVRAQYAPRGCSDLGARVGTAFFLQLLACNCYREMPVGISITQASTKSAPRGSQGLGLRHFHVRSWHKRFLQTQDFVDVLVRFSLGGYCMGRCMKALLGGSWKAFVSKTTFCKIRSSKRRSLYDDLT